MGDKKCINTLVDIHNLSIRGTVYGPLDHLQGHKQMSMSKIHINPPPAVHSIVPPPHINITHRPVPVPRSPVINISDQPPIIPSSFPKIPAPSDVKHGNTQNIPSNLPKYEREIRDLKL